REDRDTMRASRKAFELRPLLREVGHRYKAHHQCRAEDAFGRQLTVVILPAVDGELVEEAWNAERGEEQQVGGDWWASSGGGEPILRCVTQKHVDGRFHF